MSSVEENRWVHPALGAALIERGCTTCDDGCRLSQQQLDRLLADRDVEERCLLRGMLMESGAHPL
jgi:hypothetical protein